MNSESSKRLPRARALLWLLLPAAAGVALRVTAVSRARLWLDEYIMLEIASLPSASETVRSIASSNNTPLYPLLLRALPGVVEMPLLARVVSLLFSLAALALVTRTALKRWGLGAAIVSSLLIGLSAVAIHFSAEIRPYAILSFVFLLTAEALDATLRLPTPSLLVLQTVSIVLAIGLHPYGLVLLPIGPAVALLAKRPGLWRQVAVSAASLAVAIPLLAGQISLPTGASEYLRALWKGRGPLAPFITLLCDLSPASSWPAATGWPAAVPRQALAFAAIALIGLGAAAAYRSCRRRPDAPVDPFPAVLAAMIGASALLALAGALLARPVAVPGRFACALVAPFALLVGWSATLSRESRLAACGLALIAVLATTEALAQTERRGVRPELIAAQALRRNARGPSFVLTVGLTGLPLRYQLRDRRDLAFQPFPLELEEHMSWWAPGELLRRPELLAEQGERAARDALRAAASGRQVFVEGIDHPVAARLLEALSRSFRFRPISPYNRGLFELVPIRSTSP